MKPTTEHFKENAAQALADTDLQQALKTLSSGLPARRQAAIDATPEFDALRDQAREIKNHTIDNLDHYLTAWATQAEANGITVHWCRTPEEARDVITQICMDAKATTMTKGKSMVSEEIGLNDHLESLGIRPVETDLGEHIVQIAGEVPSHIIAPAVHKTQDQIVELFKKKHTNSRAEEGRDDPAVLVQEARAVLRDDYFLADVGLTGANFLIAETGGLTIVTNEGNGDLTHTLAKTHIAIAGIEKVVPTRADANTLLRILARSATGQDSTVYTSFVNGPRREGELDGPEAMHVVLLDNGRSDLLGTPQQDLLRCIRCGACLNHCPVYTHIGGHAYGWVYSGPIGAALTPHQVGVEASSDLPNASSLCGRCEEVCPMRIPLPSIFRHWREQAYTGDRPPSVAKMALKAWAIFAQRPKLYAIMMNMVTQGLALLAGPRRRFMWLPFAGAWTAGRDLPAPEGKTFMAQYKAGRRR